MRGVRRFAFAVLLSTATSAAHAAGGETALSVRASEAVAPCVSAAAGAYEAGRISVETGGFRDLAQADAFVASAVEMTRALESGSALSGTEVDVARIPWVLSLESGNPLGIRGLADLSRPGTRLVILGGPAAYEARRALRAFAPDHVQEATDARTLRAAPVALVPLSLAGDGERITVELPPVVARAAVAAHSSRVEASRAFVAFLGSEAGQRGFAGCGGK